MIACPHCGIDLVLCLASSPAPWETHTRVQELEISTRAKNALVGNGNWRDGKWTPSGRYLTAGQIDAASDGDLLRVVNFGRKGLAEVRAAIKELKERK
jgi:hypothetical protein